MSHPVFVGGGAKNLTASGSICPSQCQMVGFFVNNNSGGSITLLDGGSGGVALGGAIAPANGWYWYPVNFGASAYATISGTIDVTFVFSSGN